MCAASRSVTGWPGSTFPAGTPSWRQCGPTAWYRFPTSTFAHGHVVHGVQLGYFPNGPDSVRHWGLYVTTLHQAWIPAAVALVVFLLFNYVVVGTARLHAAMARGLLRAPADPLADARAVLARPRPIPPQGLVSDRDR